MTLRRVGYLWTGFWSFSRNYLQQEPLDLANIPFLTGFTVLALLGLRRAFQNDASSAMPYALVLFFFPVVYYVTHPEVYYLRPLDPIIAILAASWMQSRRRNLVESETAGVEPLETVDFERVQA